MQYLSYVIFPVDTNYLYHTYIGHISEIERDYVYFKFNPTIKFYIKNLPNTIQEGERVLINYQEVVGNIYTSFYIKTIDIVPNLKSNSLTMYCLFCGNKLLLSKFKRCKGYIVKHYEWDDTILEDVYKYDNCNLCHDRNVLGYQCKKERYTCPHCNTIRTTEFS